MTLLTRIFFYGYVVTLVIAGAWGMVFGSADLLVFLGVDERVLPAVTVATLLSQLRFLRAVELGFGVVAIAKRREILLHGAPNRAFLMIMGLGILGRTIGFTVDGQARPMMYAFAAWEVIGWILLFLTTRAGSEMAAPV